MPAEEYPLLSHLHFGNMLSPSIRFTCLTSSLKRLYAFGLRVTILLYHMFNDADAPHPFVEGHAARLRRPMDTTGQQLASSSPAPL